MACIPIPVVQIPQLPAGITLGAALPTQSFDPKLCCKILPFPIVPPPIQLPPGVLTPAVIAALRLQLAALQAYFDARPIDCPRE